MGKEEAHNTQSAEIRQVEISTAAATGRQGEEPALTLGLLGSGGLVVDAAACSLEAAPSALGPDKKFPPLLPSPAYQMCEEEF